MIFLEQLKNLIQLKDRYSINATLLLKHINMKILGNSQQTSAYINLLDMEPTD